jgi:dihydropteroate synthase
LEPIEKTLIMGVINMTPDSFFDGGRFATSEQALQHARQLIEDGADILDIGGESSRPGAVPLPAGEEVARIAPVLEGLQGHGYRISIDTYHAATAARALDLGAWMVNDITALRGDPAMAGLVAERGCPCVLMHMQGTPETMQQAPRYDDLVDDLCAFFEERMNAAVAAGVREEAIWLDPGFGFGKTVAHNLEMLRRLNEFNRFGRPLLIGTSNKRTIGAVLGGASLEERTEGTAATVAVAICNGARCVRVHDVKTMARVARMTDAIRGCRNYE